MPSPLFQGDGLDIGIISGKTNCNSSDKPKLIEAFKERIFLSPYLVKCSLFLINTIACLKSI